MENTMSKGVAELVATFALTFIGGQPLSMDKRDS